MPESFAWNASDVSGDGKTSFTNYYAKWTPLTVEYAFETDWAGYDFANISGDTDSSTEGKTWPDWTVGNSNGRAGYTFNGWYANDAGNGAQIEKPESFAWNASAPNAAVSADGLKLTYTVYASWTANDASIMFLANPDNIQGLTAEDQVLNGKTDGDTGLTEWPKLENTNSSLELRFGGWKDAEGTMVMTVDRNGKVTSNVPVPTKFAPGDVEYEAQWVSTAEHVVEFTTAGTLNNGVRLPESFAVLDGEAIPADQAWPGEPWTAGNENLRAGYSFNGWKNAAGEIATAYPQGVLADDLTYTADWTALPAYIQFVTQYTDAQGNTLTGSSIEAIEGVTDGDVASANGGSLSIPTSTLAGYSVAWYNNAQYTGDAMTQLPDKFAPGTTTLYAKWTAQPASITLHANSGAIAAEALGIFSDQGDGTYKVEGTTGAPVSNWRFPAIARTGYTFLGWFDNEGMTGAAKTQLPTSFPVGDTNYYAKWTEADSTISFVTNGGTAVEAMTGKTNQAISDTKLPETTRTGYDFAGWYENADLSGEAATALPGNFPAGGKTYYAKWTEAQVTIAFESGNEQVSNPESWTGAYKASTEKDTWPELTLPDGDFRYEFVGWANDKGAVQQNPPATFPASDVTYHGVWKQVGYSAITFDWGYGELSSMVEGPTGDAVPSTVTFPEVEREGYELRGWVDEDGRFATSLIDTYRDYTYLAMWTASTSTIAFDANGGSAVASKVGKTDGAIKTRTMPTTTKTGYTFDGWFDNAELSGTAVEQLPETFPAGGATYYAKWAPATSEFTFVTNGGSDAAAISGETDSNVVDQHDARHDEGRIHVRRLVRQRAVHRQCRRAAACDLSARHDHLLREVDRRHGDHPLRVQRRNNGERHHGHDRCEGCIHQDAFDLSRGLHLRRLVRERRPFGRQGQLA